MKSQTFFQLPVIILLAAGLVWTVPPVRAAAVITVTLLADVQAPDGQCTLREAIINANNDNQSGSVDCPPGAGADTINIPLTGTILLNATLPVITSPLGLTIDGFGTAIISGNNVVQVFINGPLALLTLQNLTVIDGNAGGGSGGGANNLGTLNVINCTFDNNHAKDGGGIFSGLEEGVVLFVDSSTFSNNGAINAGGGIHNHLGTMRVINSTFFDNSALSGGGIYNNGGLPIPTVTNSTLSNNTAPAGGGISNNNASGTILAENTIIALNLPAPSDCAGLVTDGGNNLASDATCAFNPAVGSMNNTNPLLASQIGNPAYFPLTAASLAVDGVTWNAPNNCPGLDQPGVARPQDGNGDGVLLCDIGASEYILQPGVFGKTAPADTTINVSTSPTLSWGTSSGATSYDYCYNTASNCNSPASWTTAGANTSATLSGLVTSTTYYWQVRAHNASGIPTDADGGTWWSFTTVPPPPGAFGKSGPANGTKGVKITPTLSWGASTGATSYDYCYNTTANCNSPASWHPAGASTSVVLAGLIRNTKYYWQVRAHNASGTPTDADGGTWWSFTTIAQKVVYSAGGQDGWILESAETSGVGGTMNATATTLRLGDNAAKKQYLSVLSFDTSTLPDTAVITKVTLKVKKQGVTGGGDPLATFLGFKVDIKKGFLGPAAALAVGDFQAAASKTCGPFSPALTSGWYSLNLTAGKAYINKVTTGGGLTQMRLYFKLDDNNNAAANYLSLYSGGVAATSRPKLIVEYYVP